MYVFVCITEKESTRGFIWAGLFYDIRIQFQLPLFIKVEKERKRGQERRGTCLSQYYRHFPSRYPFTLIFIPSSPLHLLVVRRNMLPSGPGTCSISCFAKEQGGGKRGRGGGGEQRGTEPEEETHTEKEKQRDGERGRGKKRRRLNEGLVHIHLALISQTERVMVREETERLLFLALLGIQSD